MLLVPMIVAELVTVPAAPVMYTPVAPSIRPAPELRTLPPS